jgi:hypothetical protein
MLPHEVLARHHLAWMERGNCNGREDLFVYERFDRSVTGYKMHEALRLCMTCPVLRECETWADTQDGWTHVVIAGKVYQKGKRDFSL